MSYIIRYSIPIFIGVLWNIVSLSAQENVPGLEVDTVAVDVSANRTINDYSMIGIQYGVGYSRPSFSPTMQQRSVFVPYDIGILYTRYGKMFDYMPYFGFQIGLFYGREAYAFEEDDLGRTPNIQGATSAVMEVVELPFMAHCHFDFWRMKLMVNLGFYGGYRLSIDRYGDYVSSTIEHSFLDTDIRFDYGIKAGAGIGFILDPIELHLSVSYKYAFASLYQPDYYSEYYYRYAYPTNLVISLGVHFQLTRRTGKTRRELKKEAREHAGLIRSVRNTVSTDSGNDSTTYEIR